MLPNGNTVDHRHTSVRRLLSERTKDELNLNHVVVPWFSKHLNSLLHRNIYASANNIIQCDSYSWALL